MEFAASVAVGAGAGLWLDKKFGTAPWLLLLGLVLGFSSGLYQLVRTWTIRRDGR